MAIYITESAVQSALVQEGTFFPDDQKPLSSVLFINNRTLNLINIGKGASLKLNRDNNKSAVKLLHIALFTVIPEMPNVSDNAKNAALSLKWNQGEFVGEFAEITKWLVNYFQENTAELTALADGTVGRKTINELDKALNRIGGYDEINGGTIINYALSEFVNKDTVIYTTYADLDYVPLYNKPLPNTENIKLRLKKDDIIHVLRKHPATAGGWYHVIVLSASMEIQDDEGEDNLRKAYESHVSIEGHIEASYIWEYWEELSGSQYKAPMPDIYSKLFKIPARPIGQSETEFSNEQLINIIQENYYDEVKIFPRNSDGEIFNDSNEIITFPSRNEPVNNNEIDSSPFFRFCLNLLIYANNPRPEDSGMDRSIYPDSNFGKSFYTKVDIQNAHDQLAILYESTTPPDEIYDTFLTKILDINPSGYNYIDTSSTTNQKIKVLLKDTGNYYMWIPSRQCAESLWRMVNHVYTDALPLDDPITQLAEYAIESMFPVRSLGSRFKVELGATYAFIGADFIGDISMWRQDTESEGTHIIKISAYGELRAGFDVGVEAGFGFWLGGNNKKRERPGIGAAVGASAQLEGKVSALIEFEIPITGRDPLSRGLSAMLYGGLGFIFPVLAPLAFFRAAENFNVDIWNYITKLKVYNGIYGSAGAHGEIGFKYGNTNDMPSWQNASANSSFLNATKLPSLLSGASLSGGFSGIGEFGLGFEVELKYFVGSDYTKCMRADGTRIPLEVKLFAFAEGALQFEFITSLSKGLIGIPILPSFMISEGLGIKIGIIYDISNEVVDDNTSNFDFNFGKMIQDGKKIISLYNFSGDLDRYEEFGYEAAYNFNFDALLEPIVSGDPNSISPGSYIIDENTYEFGTNLEQILDKLDGVEFKKRLSLSFMRRKYRSKKRAQSIVGNRWHRNKSKYIGGGKTIFSPKFNSFLDLDYSVKGEDYINSVKALAIMTQVSIAFQNSNTGDSDLAFLDNILNEFTDINKSLNEKINYAISLYNDTTLNGIFSTKATAGQVIYTLINMTVAEVTTRTGFFKSNAVSFSTMDERIKSMIIAMAMNYVEKWEDIRISIHQETSAGFAVGGSLGLGLKVRAFLGIEFGIVIHSDLIKEGYVYHNVWSGILRSLLNINPSVLSDGQLLTKEDKEKLIQVLFDKQF